MENKESTVENMEIKKVLVTGSEGYIGSVLMPMLMDYGYEVTGLDTCYFYDGNLNHNLVEDYPLLIKDIRDIDYNDLKDYDAVIHLAALSNDPLGKLNSALTYEINYEATINLAELAKINGVRRFIFSSSCSLYGASNEILTEENRPNPQTAYGKSKIMAEEGISALADERFCPVYLRNATAYGISPRMRFDLVVNSLAGYAKTCNEIKILGDGTPWRPLVHVRDIAATMIKVLKAPVNLVQNQAFNVGNSNENYQIKSIAAKVQEKYRNCEIAISHKNAGDTRNYNVSFDKLNNVLLHKTKITLEEGIEEIASCYDEINLDMEVFNSRLYTRLQQIEYLILNDHINNELKWVSQENEIYSNKV
jgi:nucleoside-diphosphate-sugar epimerase